MMNSSYYNIGPQRTRLHN